MFIHKIVYALALMLTGSAVLAQTSVVNYQGKLLDNGVPANGIYDIRFRLYPSALSETQTGVDYIANDVTVENGIFTTSLQFGSIYFETSNVWLETAVRPGQSVGEFTIQLPRQQMLASRLRSCRARFGVMALSAHSTWSQASRVYPA